jgi:glycosyltransferase involved in cell wall biosynthesis
MRESDSSECDIALVLEGTYPYVKGGVSSWVHQLVTHLPHWRFAAVFLGSQAEDYRGMQYTLPQNVTSLQTLYLFGEQRERAPVKVPRLPADSAQRYACLHASLRAGDTAAFDFPTQFEAGGPFTEEAFLYSEPAWEYITAAYEAYATEPSFVDYFWTVRNLHRPLWALARAARSLPRARLFLSPSTGYAGLLGVLGAQTQHRPLVLMEHGIYTKERRVDLMNADWINDAHGPLQHDPTEVSHLREMWIGFFEILGKLAYREANPIISLFETARQQQIRDGADASRTRIIPNGVDVERLARLRRAPGTPAPPVICLLGRVVRIKDIKTFIRAAHALRQRLPEAQAWIVGPEEEDPQYSRECHELAQALGLGESLRFFGFRRIEEILPEVGVLVLSSISEGLPLSILEGFAAGLPCVTTDVGACSELVYGREEQDRALGAAGAVIGLADHEALARAAAELLEDGSAYARAAEAAIRRAETYYDQRQMVAKFDQLFAERIGSAGPG